MFPKIVREIKTKADADSPELTGTPTVPTPIDDTHINQAVNIEYVTSKLGNTDSLPNQVDHANDLLTTDGTNPSWTNSPNISSIIERTPGTFEIISKEQEQNVFPLAIATVDTNNEYNTNYIFSTTPYTNENSKIFFSEVATIVTIPQSDTVEYIAIKLNVDFNTIPSNVLSETIQTNSSFIDTLLTEYDHAFLLENEKLKDICMGVVNGTILILLCITESKNMFVYVRNSNNTYTKYNTLTEYYQNAIEQDGLPNTVSEINMNGICDLVYSNSILQAFFIKDTSNKLHVIPWNAYYFNNRPTITTVPYNITPTDLQIKEVRDTKHLVTSTFLLDVICIGTDNKLYQISDDKTQLIVSSNYNSYDCDSFLCANYVKLIDNRTLCLNNNEISTGTWKKIEYIDNTAYGIDSQNSFYVQKDDVSISNVTSLFIDDNVTDIFYGLEYPIYDGILSKSYLRISVYYIKDNIIYAVEQYFDENSNLAYRKIQLNPTITIKNHLYKLPLIDSISRHMYLNNDNLFIFNKSVLTTDNFPKKLPNPQTLDIFINNSNTVLDHINYDGSTNVTHTIDLDKSFPVNPENKQNHYLTTDGSDKLWTRNLDVDQIVTDKINTNDTKLDISTNFTYLYGWGTNLDGKLLNTIGNTIQYTPVKLSNTLWKTVYVNSRLPLIAGINKDDELYIWGNNSYGQIGNGTLINNNQYTPSKISNTKWKTLLIKDQCIFAHGADDYVYFWGKNQYYQLENGNSNVASVLPQKLGSTKWKSLYVTPMVVFLINQTNTLYSFGKNTYFNLGHGADVLNQYTPRSIMPDSLKVKKILSSVGSSGCTHILDTDDYLWAWGSNSYGQLGIGNTTTKYTPYKIGSSKWKNINIDTYTTIGIDENDHLYVWGCNNSGQVGNGNSINQYTPFKISDTRWKTIYQNNTTTMITDENDLLYVWGNNYRGQLGTGSGATQYTPFKISDTKWSTIAIDPTQSITFGIDYSGTLYGWGDNLNNYLGITTANIYQYTPLKLNDTKWKSIAVKNKAIFAITQEDYLYTWGSNNIGNLGNGNTTAVQYTPMKISNTKWKNIPGNTKMSYNLFLGSEIPEVIVTVNNEKLAFLKDIPITIDENGDYVLG